jgi:hypothetical protein
MEITNAIGKCFLILNTSENEKNEKNSELNEITRLFCSSYLYILNILLFSCVCSLSKLISCINRVRLISLGLLAMYSKTILSSFDKIERYVAENKILEFGKIYSEIKMPVKETIRPISIITIKLPLVFSIICVLISFIIKAPNGILMHTANGKLINKTDGKEDVNKINIFFADGLLTSKISRNPNTVLEYKKIEIIINTIK